MKDKSVTEFFEKSKPAFANYDLLRKLPCFIDGLKVSQRKLLWTGFSKARDFLKTDSFANITTVETAYVHGSGNLCGVCDTLVQEFVGANNYQLFEGNTSGWGCRINPVVSAPRYTRLRLAKIAPLLFNDDDSEIAERQYFEQQWIEPRHLVPVFPVLFLNGSMGLSVGFSCTIHPRNPLEIVKYIKGKLKGVSNPKADLAPWFRGFTGQIVRNADGAWESRGVIVRDNLSNYRITEIPVGMDYQKYIGILDKLVEDKVIVDYDDCCDPKKDTILFKVKTTRQFSAKNDDPDGLLKIFKLSKSLPENLNCIDAQNRIREFGSVEEILDAYIDVRMGFYAKRKAHLEKKIRERLTLLVSKFVFCSGVVDGSIKVSNVPKADIEARLDGIERIVRSDGSYDYLLKTPIYQLTREKLDELKALLKKETEALRAIAAATPVSLWEEDLKKFLDFVKKT